MLVQEAIAHLKNSNQPLLNSELAELSNLSPEEIELFKGCWPVIEVEKRRQILSRLIDLAENNLELNFDSIFKYCMKDSDAEIQSQAIDGLWENEEPSLISRLIHLLEQSGSERVQIAAATALGKFVMLAEDRKLRSHYIPSLQESLLAALNDKGKTIEVRRRVLETVAPSNFPQVKIAIMQTYRGTNSKLKTSSIYAMGKNCDPSWLPVLQKELQSTNTEDRYEAVGACGELEEEAAVSGLKKLIDDPDVDVRLAAIQALGKIGGTQAKECLESCLDKTSDTIQQAAVQALQEIRNRENPLSLQL